MPRFRFDLFLRRRSGEVRSIDDAVKLGVPVLGSISEFDPQPGARLPGEDYPEALEAYHRLTDAIRLPDFHLRGRAIVVTCVTRGAGTSTVAKNLATLLSQDGNKAILVDANLNRVAQRRPGDGTSSSGFAGLLVNQLMRPSNAVVHTMDPRLKLLPAGSISGTVNGLLRSSSLPRTIDGLREMADYVILDVGPMASDLPNLTRLADLTLVVLRSGVTSQKEAARAVETLKAANSGLMGIVLNRAPVVIAAPAPVAVTAPVAEPEEPEKRLEIAVDDLLADLEAALDLIRDLRHAGTEEEEAPEAETTAENEAAELVTMDR